FLTCSRRPAEAGLYVRKARLRIRTEGVVFERRGRLQPARRTTYSGGGACGFFPPLPPTQTPARCGVGICDGEIFLWGGGAKSAAGLAELDGKLRASERLTLEDGVALFNSPDLLAVGALANREREKRHGARTYFNYNLRLEPTNVCVASCLFCSFARLQPSDA